MMVPCRPRVHWGRRASEPVHPFATMPTHFFIHCIALEPQNVGIERNGFLQFPSAQHRCHAVEFHGFSRLRIIRMCPLPSLLENSPGFSLLIGAMQYRYVSPFTS